MRTFSLSIFLLICSYAYNQDNINLIANGSFSGEKLANIQWKNSDLKYTYANNNSILIGGIKSPKEKVFLTLEELNKTTGKNFNTIPYHYWMKNNILVIKTKKEVIFYNSKSKKTEIDIALPSEAKNINIGSNKCISYTIGNNLFITDSTNTQQIITSNPYPVFSGCDSSVYQNEFNTKKATLWSPKGNMLLFYEVDMSNQTIVPIVRRNKQTTIIDTVFYPYSGNENQKIRIGIYNLQSKSTTFIKTPHTDNYLTNPCWNPDESSVFIVEIKRNQKQLWVKEYDSESGTLAQTLI